MRIARGAFVEIEFSLSLPGGVAVDGTTPGETMGFVLGEGRCLAGVEERLVGLEEGAELSFVLEADQAFGEANPCLCQTLQRDQFPEDLALLPGEAYDAEGPRGPVRFRVSAVEGDRVTIDFNHPLAGKTLHVELRILVVRPAEDADRVSPPDTPLGVGGCLFCEGGCHPKGD